MGAESVVETEFTTKTPRARRPRGDSVGPLRSGFRGSTFSGFVSFVRKTDWKIGNRSGFTAEAQRTIRGVVFSRSRRDSNVTGALKSRPGSAGSGRRGKIRVTRGRGRLRVEGVSALHPTSTARLRRPGGGFPRCGRGSGRRVRRAWSCPGPQGGGRPRPPWWPAPGSP
jgi:hypothetical protein